jgi:hypothetical protein
MAPQVDIEMEELRVRLSNKLFSSLPPGLQTDLLEAREDEGPDAPMASVVFAGVPVVRLEYAANNPLPPNFFWIPAGKHPGYLEAYSPSLREGATSSSLRVLVKDCWERWEKFTGWSQEHTHALLKRVPRAE